MKHTMVILSALILQACGGASQQAESPVARTNGVLNTIVNNPVTCSAPILGSFTFNANGDTFNVLDNGNGCEYTLTCNGQVMAGTLTYNVDTTSTLNITVTPNAGAALAACGIAQHQLISFGYNPSTVEWEGYITPDEFNTAGQRPWTKQ